jgi:hypothetical protein
LKSESESFEDLVILIVLPVFLNGWTSLLNLSHGTFQVVIDSHAFVSDCRLVVEGALWIGNVLDYERLEDAAFRLFFFNESKIIPIFSISSRVSWMITSLVFVINQTRIRFMAHSIAINEEYPLVHLKVLNIQSGHHIHDFDCFDYWCLIFSTFAVSFILSLLFKYSILWKNVLKLAQNMWPKLSQSVIQSGCLESQT